MNSVSVISASFLFILYEIYIMNNVVADDNLDSHPNLGLLPDNCGERIVLFKKVSNRNDAFINQFPFMATLLDDKKNPQCAGTLINERYVLTSAFCARNKFNVRVGEYNFKTELDCDEEKDENGERSCNHPVQDIPIENITIHEGYDWFKDDIALVRLAQPANLTTNNVRTICLPKTSELKNTDYETGQISSFSVDSGYYYVLLKRGFVHVIKNREQCEKVYLSKDIYLNIKNKFICGHVDKITGISGWTGAPLFQLKKVGNHEKYLQFGIWIGLPEHYLEGFINEKGGLLFLNVSEYMQWILDNLKP